MLEQSIEYYDNEIENKIYKFVKLLKMKKLDKKEIKTNKIKKLDLTAYILLDGYNMDARLTANGWWIGIYVWKNSKVFEIKDYLNINNIQIVNESNQHLWVKYFDYNEEIEGVVDYFLKIYNLVKQ
jgi:hypothetical protein